MFLKSLFLFIKLVYYSVLSKIRNSIEAYMKSQGKKTDWTEAHLNFQGILNLRKFWDIETSWKFRCSNNFELITVKLKQAVTMIRLIFSKKEPLRYVPVKTFPDFCYWGYHYNLCALFLKFLKLLIVLFVSCLFFKTDLFSELKQLNRSKATSHFFRET